jgi:hypothetical protein
MTRAHVLCSLVALVGCGAKPSTSDGGLRLCPSAAGANCFLLTPAETGLRGEGADTDQLAARPGGDARGTLLVFLNGSGGTPADATSGGLSSWYATARDEGLHVLGVSYRSGVAVGTMCKGDDACFEPTRVAQLTGVPQAGAASALDGLLVDEGVEVRLAAALKVLATRDPAGGWDAFTDASDGGVQWAKLFVSGHSQGGGHAALVGKRHAVARVVMLAAPCDALADGNPAAWLSDSTGWATSPATRFFGLWAEGDLTCPAAPAAWERLGMPSTARDVGVLGCAGQAAHSAPLHCTANVERWRAVLR